MGYAKVNSSFLTVVAGRINSIKPTHNGDIEVEFEDIDSDTILKTVMQNIKPETFVESAGDQSLADVYKYICAMKKHLERYEPETIGLEAPGIYDIISEMDEEEHHVLRDYLLEQFGSKQPA